MSDDSFDSYAVPGEGREGPLEPFPGTDAECFIQWKGTDVCMDVYCRCGEHFHIDDYFAYYVRCPNCRVVYEVGTQVKLTIAHGPFGIEPRTDPEQT